MRRVAVIMGLWALLVPMAAWASGIDLSNQFGTVTFTNSGLVSTGSELMSFGGIKATAGHDLGTVSFSTGAFSGTSIWSGGTFSATGSSFDVIGIGAWAKALTGATQNPVTLFTGSFVGPISWTVVSHVHDDYIFLLSGAIWGELYNGRYVSGTTTQTIYAFTDQEPFDHKGGIRLGKSNLAVPEPGTLGLLGTGLIAIAGSVRRKFLRS
ncbi:MAG TPA: PEP-CTERM sorting domain-containing protein [Terriglobales bacterium]|nr:PEP-CTERM sorting domain-containing protein [Terriglobales bacterium]